MLEINIKNRIVSVCLMAFIGLFMLCSSVQASPSTDPERPDWWDDADATIIFDPIPSGDITTPLLAGGTGGYTYTAYFNETSFQSNSFTTMNIFLSNEEKPQNIKFFWVGLHYNTGSEYAPDESFVDIVGHYNDGSGSTVDFDSFELDATNGWAYWGASLSPQPVWENFDILVNVADSDGDLFDVDYIEVATKADPVPLPSAIFLLGGGLIGLAGFVRRKNNS